MSQPSFESGSPVMPSGQKPKANIYTVLLAIALVALLIGCIFLWLEISAFGGWGHIKGSVAQAFAGAQEISRTTNYV